MLLFDRETMVWFWLVNRMFGWSMIGWSMHIIKDYYQHNGRPMMTQPSHGNESSYHTCTCPACGPEEAHRSTGSHTITCDIQRLRSSSARQVQLSFKLNDVRTLRSHTNRSLPHPPPQKKSKKSTLSNSSAKLSNRRWLPTTEVFVLDNRVGMYLLTWS